MILIHSNNVRNARNSFRSAKSLTKTTTIGVKLFENSGMTKTVAMAERSIAANINWDCSYTVEPRFNDLRYNDIPGITINNRLPSKSYSKMYGAEPLYDDVQYNDIPGLTMGLSLTERKIFPVITIKSTSQTTGSANIVNFV